MTTTTARRRAPLAAIVGYTVRTCLPARRFLLLLPTVAAVLFGLLAHANLNEESHAAAFAKIGGAGIHGLILPISCLVIGDALLGAELRSGTFAFTWLSPVPYRTIVLGRWLGGCVISAAALVPAVVLAALVASAPSTVWPSVVAITTASWAYLALFIAIGVTFRRPVVWSLVLVILVERLLGAALDGIAQLTPAWLAQGVLVGLADLPHHRVGVPQGWAAVVRLALVAAVALTVATWRLRQLRPAGASD